MNRTSRIDKSELLFHGTVKDYHKNMVRIFDRYQHLPSAETLPPNDRYRIYFHKIPYSAMNHAVKRREQYGDSPIILITRPDLITPDSDLEWLPQITCRFLEEEMYRIFAVKLYDSKITEKSLEGFKELEEEVLTI